MRGQRNISRLQETVGEGIALQNPFQSISILNLHLFQPLVSSIPLYSSFLLELKSCSSNGSSVSIITALSQKLACLLYTPQPSV